MLQQILRDMTVSPEILAELDETQKQTLFCRMREEQVRRWRSWDQKLNKQEEVATRQSSASTKKKKKTVNFLMGENDEPWVWIMGEHENDKSIEQILEEEAQEKARTQAMRETEELRKSVEREFNEFIQYKRDDINSIDNDSISSKTTEQIEDSMNIYCSVDELREKMKKMTPEIKTPDAIANNTPANNNYSNYQKNNKQNINYKNNITNFNLIEGRREILQEINPNKSHKVATRVALWERRVTEERTTEILKGLRTRQAQALKEAEETARSQHTLWQEQERRAKEAELQMREIARRAREEHRKSSVINDKPSEVISNPPSSLDSADICYTDPAFRLAEDMKPPSKEAIVLWFKNNEQARGAGKDDQGNHAKWFHGLITRTEAERLLQSSSVGSYLVRVSERIWGYAISYRDMERCKHYLVDASRSSHYQFLGDNQVPHKTLAQMVSYHNKKYITEAGKEVLTTPCETNQVPQIMANTVS